MANEIKVGIGAKLDSSFRSTVQQVKDAVRSTVKETAGIAAETAKVAAEHKALGVASSVAWTGLRILVRRSLADILPSVGSVLGGLGLITGSVKILSGAMWLMEKASGAAQVGLAKFGMVEDIQKRLEGVAGGAEAAKAKVKELAATFSGTDVTLGDAADAYKNSEVMTGGALSDKKGMTMLGDVATESGNGIKETSLAIGRFYDDLQAGQPIEETSNKLRDMGIISADVHSKITGMLSEGKSGVEVWDMLTQSFERSAGSMARARDNLNSLQKAAGEAKDKLYILFAENTVKVGDGGAKDQLKNQIQVLEDLQPVAEEAGNLYANLTAKTEKTGFSLDRLYAGLLENIGGLKKWVDVLFVGGAALVGFAAGVPVVAATLFTLAAGTLAIGGVIVGAVAAIGAAFFIHAVHVKEAAERQDALISRTVELNNHLKKERDSIGSIAEKADALAHAYTALKQARDALAAAKDPLEKDQLALRVNVAQRGVDKLESIDDDTLTGSDPRVKSEKELADLQSKAAFEALDDQGKTDALHGNYTDAATKSADLRQKWADARGASGPGATQAAETARTAYAAQLVEEEKASEAYEKQRKLTEAKEETKKTRLEELAIEQQLANIETQGLARTREEWALKRAALVTEVAAADKAKDAVKAAEARTKLVQGDAQQRAGERGAADNARQIEVEMKIAALQGEGIDRINQESDLRLGLIEARWKEAAAAKDALAVDRERLAYFQEQVRRSKEIETIQQAAADRATQLKAAQDARGDNREKRAADAALAAHKITPEQRRALDVDELRKKQKQANDEAVKMEADAEAERKLGHAKKADNLDIEATKRRQEADTFGFDADDLERKPASLRPVSDSLAKLGLGGGVGPTGKDPLIAINEDQKRSLAEAVLILRDIRDGRQGGGKPGNFGR